MSNGRRARWPWVVWAAIAVSLIGTIVLTLRNQSLDEDPYFIPLAVILILGYPTVGAVLASRDPESRIGWLMIAIGALFGVVGLSSEYTIYAHETDPGSLPFAAGFALVSNVVWVVMFGAAALLLLLFPTGRVPGPRWRHLPATVVVLTTAFLAGSALEPGVLDLDVPARVTNPFGVEAFELVAGVVVAIGWTGMFLSLGLSVAAIVLRYRRSRGEERQQIRWLAYVVGTTTVLIVVGIASAIVLGDSYFESIASDLVFLTGFALIALGVPIAMGVSVLKYRLYDLDLVVKKTVLYGIVAALLTAVFVAVFLAIGWIAGGTDVGAVVAAGAIGLAFWPAVRLARRLADRIVYGRRATPYEVLAEFSGRVGGSYGDEDVLPRMAQILRDAVGAARATVWLRVERELRPAAVVPGGEGLVAIPLTEDGLPSLEADTAVEVRDRGELLGALAVTMPPNDPLTPSRERLVRDLAAQAGLVLRNVRLIEELRASRQRLVAAQDQERRRIERNIHDGAQQQLVALAVKLRLADALVGKDEDGARRMLAELQGETNDALENLRDLARGIYPPLLADKGLAAALEAQARKSPLPVDVESDGLGRYPQEVEAAVYFCTLEALQNISKYARAERVQVSLTASNGQLRFEVEDDGRGFDVATASGTGLINMRDRLDALGGTLDVRSAPGSGTTVVGTIPVGPVP